MTKKEKFQKALEKWVNAHKESKNCIVEKHYAGGYCWQDLVNPFDIYSPICYKYRPDWLEADYRLIVGYEGDNIDYKILFLQNSEGLAYVGDTPLQGFDDVERIPIEGIPEEMLDEMLAVKDFEPIVTIKVPDPTPKVKIDPHGEYKKLVRERRMKDLEFVMGVIAIGLLIFTLIRALC